MLRVPVLLREIGKRRAPAATVRVHPRPLVQQVRVHRLLERLPAGRTQTILMCLQRQREQAVNLRPAQALSAAQEGDGDSVCASGPQLSEDAGGLRVAETLREKSGTATFDRIRSLASFTN